MKVFLCVLSLVAWALVAIVFVWTMFVKTKVDLTSGLMLWLAIAITYVAWAISSFCFCNKK